MKFQFTKDIRIHSLLISTVGIGFLATGLVPVVSSDGLARTALSLACLLAGASILVFDFIRYREITDPRAAISSRLRNRKVLAAFLSSAVLVFAGLISSFTTLSQFYGQRLKHDRLLDTGRIAQARVLSRCGWRTHGCLTIDVSDDPKGRPEAKRIQKSIPIDLGYYRDLREGDQVSVVYPVGDLSAAVFTGFHFDRWKPRVPRSWGLILFCLLAAAWYPLKSRINRRLSARV